MREQTSPGGRFTFAGLRWLNRIGYGAMQLAGQDGDKRVWGPPRDIPVRSRSFARLSHRRESHQIPAISNGPHVTIRSLSSAASLLR